jgi:hypothetical protein
LPAAAGWLVYRSPAPRGAFPLFLAMAWCTMAGVTDFDSERIASDARKQFS